jgi:hypothetical protein
MIVVLFLSNSIPSILEYKGLRLSTVMLVKLLQPSNAKRPIDVTEEGMVMLVKLLQKTNA